MCSHIRHEKLEALQQTQYQPTSFLSAAKWAHDINALARRKQAAYTARQDPKSNRHDMSLPPAIDTNAQLEQSGDA
jgi:hypothetical protein